MAPRRFRWHRLSAVLRYDSTGTVEIVTGLCFVLLPGLFLVSGWSVLPSPAAWYLSHLGVNDFRLGVWAVVIGLAQVWAAATNWYAVRAWIATGVAASLAVVVMAYWSAGYEHRPAVAFMLGMILAEMFVAWRCWHERPDLPGRKVGTRADVPIQ